MEVNNKETFLRNYQTLSAFCKGIHVADEEVNRFRDESIG